MQVTDPDNWPKNEEASDSRHDKVLLFGQSVWVTVWDREAGYVARGPYELVGVEIECDGLRGVDHLIVRGAVQSHFGPDYVHLSLAEAEKKAAKEERRRSRRDALHRNLSREGVADETLE